MLKSVLGMKTEHNMNIDMKNLKSLHKNHQEVMHSILINLQSLPLSLKGGSALLFCYGLDRHSEDLDFDCPFKLNLKSKIIQSLKNSGILVEDFKTIKHTDITSRYKLYYKNDDDIERLKIEVKNNNIQATKAIKVNGINTYPIGDLFDMKMKAANLETGRAKIRDLYDLGHILKNHKDMLTNNQIKIAEMLNKALKEDTSLFVVSHQKDKILKSIPIEKIIGDINKALTKTAKQQLLKRKNVIHDGITR